MIIEMTLDNIGDINKPNQSYDVIGRIIPVYIDGVWSFSERLYDESYEKNYPGNNENWENYVENPNRAVFFYYNGNKCVGQIILRKNWNKYAFIEDISVSKNYRNKGVGSRLLQKAIEWAKSKNLLGLMLESQDVNLLACRFYNKMGFQIGAVDTMLYANFDTADEKAIFWYMKF